MQYFTNITIKIIDVAFYPLTLRCPLSFLIGWPVPTSVRKTILSAPPDAMRLLSQELNDLVVATHTGGELVLAMRGSGPWPYHGKRFWAGGIIFYSHWLLISQNVRDYYYYGSDILDFLVNIFTFVVHTYVTTLAVVSVNEVGVIGSRVYVKALEYQARGGLLL